VGANRGKNKDDSPQRAAEEVSRRHFSAAFCVFCGEKETPIQAVETHSLRRCNKGQQKRNPTGRVVVAVSIHGHYDREARRLEALLPSGPRVGVLGSTEFWHTDSEHTCSKIGRLLAGIPSLVLLTGGVEGIGEAIGRSFYKARRESEQEPRIYHVLPEGEEAWDYGETFFTGSDMTERRQVLGRLSRLFLMVEGGPGAGHEAEIASGQGAVVIPVGRSGGHAAALYAMRVAPPTIDAGTWATLGSSAATPEETATAVLRAVQLCLKSAY
jgi:predicted Rossmann-fold nucleotide-binding protein